MLRKNPSGPGVQPGGPNHVSGRPKPAKKKAAKKKKPRSAAQIAAAKKWHKAGAKAWKRAGHKKHSAAAKRSAATKKRNLQRKKHQAVLPLVVDQGSTWALGLNDQAPTCSATAIANQRLWLFDIETPTDFIVNIWEYAGESIPASAAEFGAIAWPALKVIPGVIVGVSSEYGKHAALVTEYGWISWGQLIHPFGQIEEVWVLEWPDDHLSKILEFPTFGIDTN